MRANVVGFLGTALDAGKGAGRWSKWRPTVSICQHTDVQVERFELLVTTDRDLELAAIITRDIAQASPDTHVIVTPLGVKDPWNFESVYAALFDFARARPISHDENLWVHITTGTHVAQICLFLLAEAKHLPGKLLQTSPRKRPGGDVAGQFELIDLDLSRYDLIAKRFARDRVDGVTLLKSGIATKNPAFNRTIEEIERVAIHSRAPMLLTGPTGAGKSLLARQIWELRRSRHRMSGRFVDVNCATLRGDGANSTLFGHVKGSFTGAINDRQGLLRSADKGVLFLDEIGELGADEQAMLLLAIEEKRFYPVGSDKEAHSDFQLIAGTHRDLSADVSAGRFRDDLLARISPWTFRLPSLAERREDIEPNLEFQLDQFARIDGRRARFAREARDAYLAFATSTAALWPGNFRDLAASVMRMATLAEGGRITLLTVRDEVARLRAAWSPHATPGNVHARNEGQGYPVVSQLSGRIDLFDQAQLAAVIDVCLSSASLSEAGRRLFSVSRALKQSANDADRLRKYLARFGLTWNGLRAES